MTGSRPDRAKILSVSQLNESARFLLEEAYAKVWVEGEISNFHAHRSGHHYFSLKDSDAQIAAVMFRHANQALRFQPQDGLRVVARGRVSLYEPRGTYQIRIETMEPRGVGALQLAFEQLKERLQKEGLFDADRKRPLPALPRRIAVVTSPSGAAIRDILNVLRRRYADLQVSVVATSVQGGKAAAEIVAAIEAVNRLARHDVLILTRGGGSIEDLWPFNEEAVARAVAGSAIPVISAVGHEIDFTIADFVADLRAPTPSAAAELVVESKRALQERLQGFVLRLRQAVRLLLSGWQRRVAEQAGHRAFRSVEARLAAAHQRSDELVGRLARGSGHCLEGVRRRFEAAFARLGSLSPLAVLERGFAVCRDAATGRVLTRGSDTAPGRRVEVRLHRGRLTCEVKEVQS